MITLTIGQFGWICGLLGFFIGIILIQVLKMVEVIEK